MTKKLFFAALAAVVLSLGLVACGDDKNDNPAVQEKATASFSFDPKMNEAFQLYGGTKLSYKITDANGTVVKQQSMQEQTTAVEIKNIECPCKVEFSFAYLDKSESAVDDQKYTVQFGPVYTVESNNVFAKKEVLTAERKGSTLKKIMARLASRTYEHIVTVDKDGKVTGDSNGEEIIDLDALANE